MCWLARLPELTLVTAPPLAVLVGWLELPGPGTTATVADVSVLVALVFCWAAAVERLTARRRQRRPAEHAARVRHPSPAPAVPLRRGRTPITAGLLLLGAAVFAVVQGVGGTVADRHHAHRAERITARVLGHGEESVRLRAGDGRLLTLSASSPGGYRRGSTVTVLEDGTWRRLLAEPYDASGRQLLGLATGLPGGSMLLTGLLARRRAAALRGVPVPVLRVLERADEHGRTWVHATDDSAGRTPVFSARFAKDKPGPDGPGMPAGGAGTTEEGPSIMDTRLHEAVMFGSPYEGGELVLATTDRHARPILIRTTGPVRPLRAGHGPALAAEVTPGAAARAADAQAVPSADGAPTPLVPSVIPRRWGPGILARVAGLLLALCSVTGMTFIVHSFITDGIGWRIFLVPLLVASSGSAAQLLNWRVLADVSGLWLTGAWRVRHVPWDRMRGARCADGEGVAIAMADGSTWRLSSPGVPRLERRLNSRLSYVRMVEEITVLHARPELRPTQPVAPRDRGLPLGPALLALSALAIAVWVFA